MGRPWVAFDPAIKKHREWFAHFQHEKSWSHCPVRFIIGDDAGDLVTLCQRRLIDYYTKREFNKSTVQVAPGSQ
jgi:hypothetical protein